MICIRNKKIGAFRTHNYVPYLLFINEYPQIRARPLIYASAPSINASSAASYPSINASSAASKRRISQIRLSWSATRRICSSRSFEDHWAMPEARTDAPFCSRTFVSCFKARVLPIHFDLKCWVTKQAAFFSRREGSRSGYGRCVNRGGCLRSWCFPSLWQLSNNTSIRIY